MSPPPVLPESSVRSPALRLKFALLMLVIVVLAGLAVAWSWSPMRQWLDLDRLVTMLVQLGATFGPALATLCFSLALALAIPLTFLTLVLIVAFGPVMGFFCTMASALAGALVSYALGAALGRDVVRRLGGARVNAVSRRLAERGVLTVIAVRIVPVAPFAIVNMIAGASHVRLRDFLLGTLLGMTPGTLVMAAFVNQIIAAMRQPSQTRVFLLLIVLVMIVFGLLSARRWMRQAPDT